MREYAAYTFPVISKTLDTIRIFFNEEEQQDDNDDDPYTIKSAKTASSCHRQLTSFTNHVFHYPAENYILC